MVAQASPPTKYWNSTSANAIDEKSETEREEKKKKRERKPNPFTNTNNHKALKNFSTRRKEKKNL